MKIALIGGSGFIGNYLVSTLKKDNHTIDVLDIQKTTRNKDLYKYADIRKPDSLLEFMNGTDIIINLAAVHHDDVEPQTLYQEVNVVGAKNICKIASQKKIKHIVFISSVAVYGFPDSRNNENSLLNPYNEYGITKASAERVFESWQQEIPDERKLVIIRPTVVFGPGNRGNVYNLIRTLDSGKFIMIGRGENKKSMAYVENLAAFISHVSINVNPGIRLYNYTDKPDLSMNELVEIVNLRLGNKPNINFKIPYFIGLFGGYLADLIRTVFRISLPISSIRVKKFCASTVFNSAVDTNNFVPPFTLKEGIYKTIDSDFVKEKTD